MPKVPSLYTMGSVFPDTIVFLLCPHSKLMLRLFTSYSAAFIEQNLKHFYTSMAPVWKVKYKPQIYHQVYYIERLYGYIFTTEVKQR